MTTETYHFHYSSDKGWEGDFDKLKNSQKPHHAHVDAEPISSSRKSPRFSTVLAITILLIIIASLIYSLATASS